VFVKLKLNVSFSVLAAHFGLSQVQARRCFYNALDVVFEVVKDDLIWFDRETIQARMPSAFQALFPSTRAIIDCSEIPAERSANVRERVLLYSHYKARFTLKFLLAIAPSGEITFVSKMYGGRATDTEVTVSSGFLPLVEEGDIIMSDKGFPSIETNVNKAGGIFVMPPFKSGNIQFSSIQNKNCFECASVRIHVERAIGCLKNFEVMNFVPTTLRKSMDKILVILAFVVNCSKELIRE